MHKDKSTVWVPVLRQAFTLLLVHSAFAVASGQPVMVTGAGTLNFGNTGIFSTTQAQVTLFNHGTTDLHYTTQINGGVDFTVTPETSSGTVVPSGSVVIVITFDPSTFGAKMATLTIAGDDATNPSDVVNLSGNGVKNSQTITFEPLDDHTYGDETFELVATATSGLSVTFSSEDTDVITIDGNVVTIVGAGTAIITAEQAGDELYNAAAAVNRNLTVNKVFLSVIADDKTRTYGNENPEMTYSISGFIVGESESDIDTPPVPSTSATLLSPAGNYAIGISGGVDNNYDFDYVNATLTVEKATMTAAAVNKTKIYGEENPVFTISYSGFVNGENSSVLDVLPSASSDADQTSGAGSYDIVPSGGSDDNYEFNYTNGTLTIGKATLTAVAENAAKAYGDANPVFTIAYSGFVNGENFSVLDIEPVATSSADERTNVGSYSIVCTGGLDNNYEFSYSNGTLAIGKAELLVAADDKTRQYGQANPDFTISFSGFVNGETSSVLDALPSATCGAGVTTVTGSYTIEPSGGADTNYEFNYVNGTLMIEKATLTVIADDKTKVYGDANPPLTITYSGFVNGEDASVLSIPPTAATEPTAASDAGSYVIFADGGEDDNYTFSYVNGMLAISKRSQTIDFIDPGKIFESDGSFTLSATATSMLSVSFTTPDLDKISLSGNEVQILRAGNVTITAHQFGNNNFLEAPPQSRTICIEPAKPIISGTVMDLGTVLLASSADEGNQWHRGGTAIEGAVQDTYLVETAGQYSLTVGGDGCVSVHSDPYEVLITGVSESTASEQIGLFPVPVQSELHIRLSDGEQGHITIYDAHGRTFVTTNVNGGESILNVDEMPAGHYILQVNCGSRMRTLRFVKE